MPGIPKDQLAAVRQITLLDYFLRTQPDLLVRTGNAYRTPQGHSSLSISADGTKWHYFAGHCGGSSALDYLVKVEGKPFKDAVEELSRFESLPVISRSPPPPKPLHQTFALPAAAKNSDRVMRYLTGRGIPEDMVRHCVRQGIIYESYPHHNCVFVGKDPGGQARFASLRGTMKEQQFRMDQPGSEKRYGFVYRPPGCGAQQKGVAVCESPIDALSYAALNRRYQINPSHWTELPCLSLSGTAPAAVLQYLRDIPSTDTVYLALDNDKAGKEGVRRIADAIHKDPALSKQVKHIFLSLPSPEYGKDFNEVLQALSQPQQARASPSREDTLRHGGTR